MNLLERLKNSSFAAQWLLLGSALLFIGLADSVDLWVELKRTEAQEQGRLLTQVRVIRENLVANLSSVNSAIESLAQEWPNASNKEHLNSRLKLLTDAMPGVRTLLFLDGRGASVASSRPELLGRNFAYRDYFIRPLKSGDGKTLFILPPIETTLGVYSVSVARLVIGPGGNISGVIVATLDPDYFKTLMASVLYADDMMSTIAHGEGLQFVMMPEAKARLGENLAQPGSLFTKYIESGKGASTMTGAAYAQGPKVMAAFSSVQSADLKQDTPLVVAVVRDYGSVFATWRHDVLVKGGLFLLFAIGAVLGLHIYQRRQREFARTDAARAAALASSQRFLVSLTNNLPGMVGYWNSDLRCGFANLSYLEWFGKSPEEMRGIHIRDLMGDVLYQKNEPFILAALRGERQCFERTLTKADGSIGFTWAQYIPDISEDGTVLGFYVLVSDITELKHATLALTESEQTLRTIIETEPECVHVLSIDGTLLQINRAGLAMIEATAEEEVVGKPITQVIASEYHAAFAALHEKVCRGESGSLQFEFVGKKGGRRWVETHAAPMRGPDGEIKGHLAVTRDITSQRQAELELKRMAQTDALTDLANRRHFMALAELEFARIRRYSEPLSVLMMDIDHFKKVNDTYGHRTGDMVLQKFAQLSLQQFRESDFIGRIGGEEFAVVLPHTDSGQAAEVAERLRQAVAEAEIISDAGAPIHITTSIGIASVSADTQNISMLLHCADQALYEAKASGRNRVHTYGASRRSV